MDLLSLLRSTFHHPGFRANQEAVCRAAADGRDVLLVMPTGAGKSLCYQLPAVARQGTALVISPLIALMDDQAGKLSALGLNVARIHSGLSREDSRQACRDYLDGSLNFLFIAPERLRVPGFPEMLAKRKPALVAIDEAHCISAWGHDFRPDYRTLGDHLPALRPAPVIALTATATPTVQKDIVAQLQLSDPALFIHGFRRDNLAIEVVELSKPRRHSFTADLLRDAASRPAIVYAPSRKASEDLAAELNHTYGRQTAAPYHAGLDAATRERVQNAFQAGQLAVVVATIAFGMGIDKANVRTVVHTALPGSVEAYYQEIGRAGRDGNPSRTVLLHSYADRKMHEFFFERDYPPLSDLDRVARVLREDFTPAEPLAQSIKMAPEQFEKAAIKLIAQGAAQVDVAGNLRRTALAGKSAWRKGYDAQLAFRRAQLERMAAFAETQQCRMAALVQHFGDTADGLRPCGHCDFCAPHATRAQSFVPPSAAQARHLRSILSSLGSAPWRAAGKLYSELGLPVERHEFDVLLDALARAGLISLTTESFTNSEGKVLPFKKAALTHEGREEDASNLPNVLVPSGGEGGTARAPKKRSKSAASDVEVPLSADQQRLESNLRAWRKSEAAKTGKPAFLVMTDKVLHHIAAMTPQTIAELTKISGIGADKADRYGAEILGVCRGETELQTASGADRSTQPKAVREQRSQSESPSHGGATRSTRPEKVAAEQRGFGRFDRSTKGSGAAHEFHRPAHSANPAADLTPDQQLLDQRLRDWRRTESIRVGAPPFLILGSSPLRNIVLKRPRTLAQLAAVEGVAVETTRNFGASILEICNEPL